MPTVLSPIESEFATTEEAEAYERWLRAKVEKSLDDTRPNIPHDQVMAGMRALLAKKRKTATSNSKS
ncbi:stability determinant [Paraburkholderia fungorum]